MGSLNLKKFGLWIRFQTKVFFYNQPSREKVYLFQIWYGFVFGSVFKRDPDPKSALQNIKEVLNIISGISTSFSLADIRKVPFYGNEVKI
jgi:hypothetical protein